MNASFGYAYVRYLVFFIWCKNMTCNNACNTNDITLFFVIYDLWWVCNIETDFKLREPHDSWFTYWFFTVIN